MRILILGSSGSAGSGLADAQMAWSRIVERGTESLTGAPAEMLHTRFYTWTADWEEYLENALEKGPFDVVVLSPTKFAFATFAADNRVRRLLGKKAGDWFKGQADAFDAKTSTRTPQGRRGRVNRLVHRTARRAIGQEPLSDVRTITETYLRTMARLARLEDAQVIVLGIAETSSRRHRRHPKTNADVRMFRDTLEKEAARRRFDWIDREALWTANDGEQDDKFSDGVHVNAELHRRIAQAILELMARRLPPTSDAAGLRGLV